MVAPPPHPSPSERAPEPGRARWSPASPGARGQIWLWFLLGLLVLVSWLGPRPLDAALAGWSRERAAPGPLGIRSAGCESHRAESRRATPDVGFITFCAPEAALSEDWSVDVALGAEAPPGALLRVVGSSAHCSPDRRSCRLFGAPWQAAMVTVLEHEADTTAAVARGAPLAIVWYQRKGLNLRTSDLIRLLVAGAIGGAFVWGMRAHARLRSRSDGTMSVAFGAGALIGLLAAARPVPWGGAQSVFEGLVIVLAPVLALGAIARFAIGREAARLGPPMVLGLVAATTLGAAFVGDAALRARDLQLAIIAAAVILTCLSQADARNLGRPILVGQLFALTAIALDAFGAAPLPYPGLRGVERPWELASGALAWAIAAPLIGNLPRLRERPARWTEEADRALAALAGVGSEPEAKAAHVELVALARRIGDGAAPIPNIATRAYVHTIARALEDLGEHDASRASPDRASIPLLLLAPEGGAVRATIEVAFEPRVLLFPGERTLQVDDDHGAASPSMTSATGAVLDLVEARLGALEPKAARQVVHLSHPADTLVGRSFELPLALAWYAVRAVHEGGARGARGDPRERLAGVLATGRLDGDERLAPVDGLGVKIGCVASGEILLAPLANAGEAADAAAAHPDLLVLRPGAGSLLRWRARRLMRAHARAGRRVIVLTPTLGRALDLVFG